MLAHLVSGRWGYAAERHESGSPLAKQSWFRRLVAALFGKNR